MSELAAHRRLSVPFHDPSRRSRLIKVGGWLVGIVLVVVVLNLLGVDVVGWLSDLWNQIKDVPPATSSRRCVFQSGQTLFAGLSYYGILRAAYPGQVEFWPIVTAYAVGRGDEQLPARQHRHVRDAGDVRRDHPGLHVRRVARRLPRAEDLLHDRRHVRLPVPVPVRAGLVRREPRQPLREPAADDPDRGRRRLR